MCLECGTLFEAKLIKFGLSLKVIRGEEEKLYTTLKVIRNEEEKL